MSTMYEFISDHGIKMTAKRVRSNPNGDDWVDGSWHYSCTITHERDFPLYVPFTVGPGIHKNDPSYVPDVADVLDCLASDASTVMEGQDFEEWAAELGYDQDSRQAERTYKSCQDQTHYLEDAFGRNSLELLVYDTERL